MFGPGKELHTVWVKGLEGQGGGGLRLPAEVHMLIGKCTAQRAPVEVSISFL